MMDAGHHTGQLKPMSGEWPSCPRHRIRELDLDLADCAGLTGGLALHCVCLCMCVSSHATVPGHHSCRSNVLGMIVSPDESLSSPPK
ncbi:hypothetical protein LY76DRAFT_210946 [Colletotrichum caudatum]|nr:hypothetical protein LY76DRAFT_210946 [Colletotrichum caudatum]